MTHTAHDNELPLMAWNFSAWLPEGVYAAGLPRMRECGFTVAGFIRPADLDAAHEAGMRAIVADGWPDEIDWNKPLSTAAITELEKRVSRHLSHPAAFGYYLRDEPPASMFPAFAQAIDVIRKGASDKWAYVNLLPDYASHEQLGTATWPEHVERFVKVCKPDVLSYDYYSIFEDGAIRQSYWKNLADMREAAVRHGLPFWSIVLSTAHFNFREPSPADLRFQVYNALAYGARGIAYFTYRAPALGNFRLAPVDQFGNETPTWGHLRNLNHMVQEIGPVLLKLRSQRVYHLGAVPSGGEAAPADAWVTGNLEHHLAGEFIHENGDSYVMIVNTDLDRSHACDPSFRTQGIRPHVVSPYDGSLVPYEGEWKWLAPGQGTLLRIRAKQ